MKSQWIEVPQLHCVMRYEGPEWVARWLCRHTAPDGTFINPVPHFMRPAARLLLWIVGAKLVWADRAYRPE